MATVYNLTTAEVPPVQAVSGMQSIAGARANPSGTAITSAGFEPGEKVTLRADLNENALRLEQAHRYGGSNVFAIAEGLTITATATTATVSAGQAQIGGIVELASQAIVALAVGTNRIWLRRDKTLAVTLDSVGVPSGGIPACFLGAVIVPQNTNGALDVDCSGVVSVLGSDRFRRLAEPAAPLDSPAGKFTLLTRTQDGLYLWDGTQHTKMGGDTVIDGELLEPPPAPPGPPGPPGAPNPGTDVTGLQTYLVRGGSVIWEDGLSFVVARAIYFIDGVPFETLETSLALPPADATLDRIDVIAVDDTETVLVIPGVPSASPLRPDVDPLTQLLLTFVLVPAAATAPSGVTKTVIYAEGIGEWTGSGSGPIAFQSSASPRNGDYSLELTGAVQNDYVQFSAGAPLSSAGIDNVTLFIRSKGDWGKKSLRLSFRSAFAQVIGNYVSIADGTSGFDSTSTSGYQAITIPLASFAVPAASLISSLQIDVKGGGGSIGFWIDDITLQGGVAQPTVQGGLSQAAADARYLKQGSNLSDLGSKAAARTALELGTGALLNVPATGDAAAGELVKGNDSRLGTGGGDATAVTAEVTAARTRLAITPFAATTYANLKAMMDGIWTSIATLFNRTITTISGITGGGDLNTNRTLGLSNYATATNGYIPTKSTTANELTWIAPPSSGGLQVSDEGSLQGTATSANLTGLGVQVSVVGNAATINIPGGDLYNGTATTLSANTTYNPFTSPTVNSIRAETVYLRRGTVLNLTSNGYFPGKKLYVQNIDFTSGSLATILYGSRYENKTQIPAYETMTLGPGDAAILVVNDVNDTGTTTVTVNGLFRYALRA